MMRPVPSTIDRMMRAICRAFAGEEVVAQRCASTGIDIFDECPKPRVRTGDRNVVADNGFRGLQRALISMRADADTRRSPVVHDVARNGCSRSAFQSRIALAVVRV